MLPPFSEALSELLSRYQHYPLQEIIDELESALDALRDDLERALKA